MGGVRTVIGWAAALAACLTLAACGSASHTSTQTAASPAAPATSTHAAAVTQAAAATPAQTTTRGQAATSTGTATTVSPDTAAPTAAETHGVVGLLKGIPESGSVLGRASAPVTISYFGDLECPICAEFSSGHAFKTLVRGPVMAGKVKVQFEAFCTATCNGPGQAVFNTQQTAALAAGEQNRFWDYALLFLRAQGAEGSKYVTPGYLLGLAQATPGLNVPTWLAQSKSPKLEHVIVQQQALAARDDLTGTPTLIASGPHGSRTVQGGTLTTRQINAAIKRVA